MFYSKFSQKSDLLLWSSTHVEGCPIFCNAAFQSSWLRDERTFTELQSERGNKAARGFMSVIQDCSNEPTQAAERKYGEICTQKEGKKVAGSRGDTYSSAGSEHQ